MLTELQSVARFIKDEPHRLEESLKRSKKLMGTLFTLKKSVANIHSILFCYCYCFFVATFRWNGNAVLSAGCMYVCMYVCVFMHKEPIELCRQ